MSGWKKLASATAAPTPSGLDVSDLFSTYAWTGNGTSKTITNGIDLSGEGGLVWIKCRDVAYDHNLYDTERGATKLLQTNSTDAEITATGGLTAFTSSGFSLGNHYRVNHSGNNYVGFSFRQAPKFFDIVTYTGNGTNRTISHNLGVEPAMMIVKCLTQATDWAVYHRKMKSGTSPETGYMRINSTDSETNNSGIWNNTAPTSSVFSVGTNNAVNLNGAEYVAYLFAHNDGDGTFGDSGAEDIIKCDAYTGTATIMDVDIGFEPQFLMVKASSTSGEWYMIDNLRGFTYSIDPVFYANEPYDQHYRNYFEPRPRGFRVDNSSIINSANDNYIYIAIGRSMKAPTTGTDVFNIDTSGGTNGTALPAFVSNWPVDMAMERVVDTTDNNDTSLRLLGSSFFKTNSTDGIAGSVGVAWDYNDGWYYSSGIQSNRYSWMWKRATGFFDTVRWVGNSTAGRVIDHNLGIVPEMMWVKLYSQAGGSWIVYHKDLGNTDYVYLDGSAATTAETTMWNNTSPTSTQFTLGTHSNVNFTGFAYVGLLFGSVAGVSSVGSFTVSGADVNVDCGFSSGPRYVLFKRYNSAGNWFFADTDRGLVTGDDNWLYLNTDTAESIINYVDPISSGFTVKTANVPDGDYIYYAIA